jgi:hypothetical protein
MSDRLAAAAFFEAALELSPQNSVLREYLAHFQAESENFYDEWRLELAAVAEEAASRPTPQEVDIHTLAEQRLVRVYPNGLATTWVQQIARPLTRSGADYLRSTSIGYSPDSEVVNLLSIRVLAPDGDVREIYSDNDYGPPSGPQSMYFDVHTRVITFPTLNIGDTLLFEYTISDIAYRNIFDDYFGDMFLLQDEGPRDFVRYGVIAPAARGSHLGTHRDRRRPSASRARIDGRTGRAPRERGSRFRRNRPLRQRLDVRRLEYPLRLVLEPRRRPARGFAGNASHGRGAHRRTHHPSRAH